ncbi:Phophoglucomutase [Hexamita inflata]|uniref:Phophoglucomutase n=1 Tax=Hexamita inflata TaxID=28002 RepID=A0AA86PHW3_9EUKA|nr:Phophoglucomutase [Hexamita inflata]CAI9962809.1 Phophoglucomutase [Hexamita inflata]
MDSHLQTLIDNWLRIDPDPKNKLAIEKMVEQKEFEKLKSILNPENRLEFGTAGLRGEVAPGYSCMNQVVIMQTAQGILKYVQENFPDTVHNGICICHDARHYSDIFSDITAGVFIAAGIKTYYFKQLSPTPYAAFFSEHFKCVCGVMVTASHNPSQDNGYKVYGMNRGVQIVPPHDTGVQSMILSCTDIKETTYKYASYLTEEYKQKGLYVELTEESEITQLYYDSIKQLSHIKDHSLKVKAEYSAMWGVGCVPFKRALKNFGFKVEDVNFFEDSCKPDANFGGEKRPNPEERHNMVKLAQKAQANTQVILVNDPDADRFALAERQGDDFYIFHGNEIGALLCEWQLQNTTGDDRLILCSTVSSQILKRMAEQYKIHFSETLTGFKWLATVAREQPQYRAVFAFEEAIGYTCGNNGLIVGDKDGVATACVALEMANFLYSQGKTIVGYLQEIYAKYGFHAWQNSGLTVKSMKEVAGLFVPLFGQGEKRDYCMKFGRFTVNRVRDMKNPGFDSLLGKPNLPTSGSEMLTFYCDEVSMTFRPSGTEPKVKYYIEAVSKESLVKAKEIALEFEAAFLKTIGHGK